MSRVAVVGAGPAGIYAAEHLSTVHGYHVDVFDALPVPFGLVRYGVAPDHFSIRSVRDKLTDTFESPLVRFRGNVHIGTDVSTAELASWYDAVMYTYGASADRALGIPGEVSPASIPATEFVKWYTGHPDAQDFGELLRTSEQVIVIGLGNVAVDVTRLLVKSIVELRATDMPDHVLDSFEKSAVRHVHVVGRRGPQHATFTTKELKELGELEGVEVILDPRDLPADDAIASSGSKVVERNLKVMRQWSQGHGESHGEVLNASSKKIEFHFYSTPQSFDSKQRSLIVERMQLSSDNTVMGTGTYESIPADIVIRSVGYRGLPLEGLPFNDRMNVIPSHEGKVEGLSETYVAGWIKRGPSGIIGTNKKDAVASVESLATDLNERHSVAIDSQEIDEILHARGVKYIDFEGWKRINAAEIALGASKDRARTTIHEREKLIEIGLS
jgi:NADPH-dependent glutamate synthase beta subunit-like oxidoreductase